MEDCLYIIGDIFPAILISAMSKDRISYLLHRYYTNTATTAEQEELWAALHHDEQDHVLQTALDDLIREAPPVWQMDQATADDILQSILQQAPATRYRRLHWRRWAAAAALVGAIAVGAYLLRTPATKHLAYQKPTNHSSITPGGNKAILILDDGSQLALQGADSSQVARQSGAALQGDSGLLAYNGKGPVHYHEIRTPAGGQYTVILPDGSHAFLNAASSLRYPTVFTGDQRSVTMTGEVYFDITPAANAPFSVKVGNAEVNVLGTAFNIMAYTDEPAIRTTLVQGAVLVRQGETASHLLPGQQATLNNAGQLKITRTDVNRAIAWKDGIFEFNQDIQDIMRQIARWYDVEIIYEGDIKERAYIATISRKESIEQVLSKLQEAGGVHFRIEGKKVIVMF